MKLKDTVLQSCYLYPSLYMASTYEESELLVLHHYFLVNGNGIEWAYTENKKDGGYLTSPKAKKNEKNDEWERVFDRPYGEENFEMDWNDLFGYAVTEYLDQDKDWLGFNCREDYPPELKQALLEKDIKKISDGSFLNSARISPYPFYNKGWPFKEVVDGEVKVKDIKPDWLEGGIRIVEWALKFYRDKKMFHNDEYYGDKNGEGHKEAIERAYTVNKYKNWLDVLKTYEVEEFANKIKEKDYKTLAKIRAEKDRQEYIADLERVLKLLKRKK